MTVANELILEILKKVQADVGALRAELTDVKATQLRMREDLNRFEGDILHIERLEAGTRLRLDRIDAPSRTFGCLIVRESPRRAMPTLENRAAPLGAMEI